MDRYVYSLHGGVPVLLLPSAIARYLQVPAAVRWRGPDIGVPTVRRVASCDQELSEVS